MFEAIYNIIKSNSRTVQGFHEWLTGRIDHVLAALIRKKLGVFRAFAGKFTDRLMTYLLAVVVVGFFYSLAFHACRFLWFGYRETYLGSLVAQSESVGALLAENFFAATDSVVIFSIAGYYALCLLPLLMIGRLVYVNRLFYESFPCLVTSLLWGIPLAKFFALKYTEAPLSPVPFLDLAFVQFFIPAVLLLHPAMQFVNWFMPELDDLYRDPTYFLRRLHIERELYKLKQQQRS